MRLTIDIPERLVKEVQPELSHVSEILELGLRQRRAQTSGLRREFLGFLARGPRPTEIIKFRPSEQVMERVRELLQRNREGTLPQTEEAEMDDLAEVDHLITQVKAHARQHLREK